LRTHSLLRELFSSQTTTKWSEEECEKELHELREEFLARILKRVNLNHGISLLSIILFKSRYRSEEHKGYSDSPPIPRVCVAQAINGI
jgi:hypothetical protein